MEKVKKQGYSTAMREKGGLPSNKLKIHMGHLQCNMYVFSLGSSSHQ
jgi:hypothetical protein